MTSEKREKAIKYLTEEIRSLRMAPKINGCGPENWAEQLEVMETCLQAVRGHSNQPLTLEQLRKMDGNPVWIERIGSDSPEDKEWALVFCKEKFCRTSCGNIALFGCYGIGWLAYAYPPAHIDREAWTAEWVDNDKSEEMMCKCSKCGYPVSYFWGKTEICPGCGRAMTPEAWEGLEKRLRGLSNG